MPADAESGNCGQYSKARVAVSTAPDFLRHLRPDAQRIGVAVDRVNIAEIEVEPPTLALSYPLPEFCAHLLGRKAEQHLPWMAVDLERHAVTHRGDRATSR